MIAAFLKAVGQLPDPAFRRVLLRGVGMTLALFVVLLLLVPMFVVQLPLQSIPWISYIPFLTEVLTLGGIVIFLLVLFLVFPAFATLFVSFFLDDIVAAVEARHYPGEAPGRALKFEDSLAVTARFTLVVLLANLVALPLYLLLFFLPPINLFLIYGLNGYLLSREYFELVALRHLDVASAARLRKANRAKLFVVGVIIAILLTVPIVNIVAPIVAVAFMAHIFKGLGSASGTYVRHR